MIKIYSRSGGKIIESASATDGKLPADTVWIDLFMPTEEERTLVSKALSINFPAVEEMREIEASSRLYSENDALFMTADLLIGSETPFPIIGVMSIVMTQSCVVTVRYDEPKAIALFVDRIKREPALTASTYDTLLALLDAVTDRVADIIESLGRQCDHLSRRIFRPNAIAPDGKKIDCRNEKTLQQVLDGVGQTGNLVHKIGGCVGCMARMAAFLDAQLKPKLNNDQQAKLHALETDLRSLNDQSQFILQEISFLLDATLGQINTEQNNIIKFLTIVTVAFTAPTFLASMWGMNFKSMPEYDWPHGYAMALAVMLITAILPILYFRRKKWM